jgi:peptidyl-prolyl cis-trans isomerase C
MAVHIRPRPGRPVEPPPGPSLPEQDIRVNGITITPREIAAEMQHHPAGSAAEAWTAAARALVVRRLLLDAVREAGLGTPADADAEEAAVAALLAREIRIPEPDEPACRRWLAAHPERFGQAESWEVSHILIAADPGEPEERAAADRRARRLLGELLGAPWRLAELAQRHSDCPSRSAGGDLGRIRQGSSVPEFEAALRAMRPGEISAEPVATRYGLHLVLLHRHWPVLPAAFDEAAPRVARDLAQASWAAAVRQFIGMLASRARIEGIELDSGASGPLVQ